MSPPPPRPFSSFPALPALPREQVMELQRLADAAIEAARARGRRVVALVVACAFDDAAVRHVLQALLLRGGHKADIVVERADGPARLLSVELARA